MLCNLTQLKVNTAAFSYQNVVCTKKVMEFMIHRKESREKKWFYYFFRQDLWRYSLAHKDMSKIKCKRLD